MQPQQPSARIKETRPPENSNDLFFSVQHPPLDSSIVLDPFADVQCQEYLEDFLFILPAFIRVKFDNLVQTNAKEGTADVSLTIILSIWYNQLPEELVEELQRSIRLDIGDRTHLNLVPEQFLSESSMSLKIHDVRVLKQVAFIVRGVFTFKVISDLLYYPFQDMKVKMSIKVGADKCRFLGKDALFYFNNQLAISKASQDVINQIQRKFTEVNLIKKQSIKDFELEKLSEYISHTRMLNVNDYKKHHSFELDDSSIKVSVNQQKIKENLPPKEIESYTKRCNQAIQVLTSLGIDHKSCQFLEELKTIRLYNPTSYNKTIFQMRFVRNPLQVLLPIVVPAFFLCLINIAVFFQENNLAERLASIATLLVAYSTFLPSLRDKIPDTHEIMAIEAVIYSVILNGFLSFVGSFWRRNDKTRYNWKTDPVLMVCLLINVAVVCGVMSMIVENLFKVAKIKLRRNQMKQSKHKPVDASKSEGKRYGYRIGFGEMRRWMNPSQLSHHRAQQKQQLDMKSYAELFEANWLFIRVWICRLQAYMVQSRDTDMQGIQWSQRYQLSEYYRQVFPLFVRFYRQFELQKRTLVKAIHLHRRNRGIDERAAADLWQKCQENNVSIQKLLEAMAKLEEQGIRDIEYDIVRSPRQSFKIRKTGEEEPLQYSSTAEYQSLIQNILTRSIG